MVEEPEPRRGQLVKGIREGPVSHPLEKEVVLHTRSFDASLAVHKPFKSTQICVRGLESYRVNGFDLFIRSNKGVYGRFNETQ